MPTIDIVTKYRDFNLVSHRHPDGKFTAAGCIPDGEAVQTGVFFNSPLDAIDYLKRLINDHLGVFCEECGEGDISINEVSNLCPYCQAVNDGPYGDNIW